MVERRRPGDHRPYRHQNGVELTLTPHGEPFRWLPRHGDPYCVVEWVSQQTVRALAHLPVYTAIIATLTLVVVLLTR